MGDLFPSTPMGGDDPPLPSLSLSLNSFPHPSSASNPNSASSNPPVPPNVVVPYAAPLGANTPTVPIIPTLSASGNMTPIMQREAKPPEFRVALVVAERYFNRMQWYPVTIKFTDDQVDRPPFHLFPLYTLTLTHPPTRLGSTGLGDTEG